MNNILEETRFIINKYNIRANKSLGQNFLINENVVSSIVECSNITKEDTKTIKDYIHFLNKKYTKCKTIKRKITMH